MKKFISGVIIGTIISGSIGYASTNLQNIEVSFQPIQFFYNNTEVKISDKENYIFNGTEYVPASFIYKGTTYVPLRFIGETVDMDVEWNSEKKAIYITEKNYTILLNKSFNEADLESSLKDEPQEIKEWIKEKAQEEYSGFKAIENSTYVLVSMGQRNTGGYKVNLTDIKETEEKLFINAEYTHPAPKQFVSQVLTYPVLLVKIDKQKEVEITIL